MPDVRLIDANASMDATTLFDWYISSVSEDDTPVWTREHIDELMRDFLVIPINTPTIDAQPVKNGKWSEYSRNALETYIECTNCCVASRPIHLQMVTRNGSGLPDYCPNCGAKMGGVADER